MSLYERFLATEKVIYFANIQKICFMLFRIFIFLLPSMSQICCCTVPEIIENTLKHNKNNLCFERFIQGYKIEEKHTRSMTQLGVNTDLNQFVRRTLHSNPRRVAV
ncbi:Protein of unknown function [Gryllus bimaculatus]|nr:Protein of unknown function [Gryllus bimaculatus]